MEEAILESNNPEEINNEKIGQLTGIFLARFARSLYRDVTAKVCKAAFYTVSNSLQRFLMSS